MVTLPERHDGVLEQTLIPRTAAIHEEFGDRTMRAIDLKMDLQREPNPAGDRDSIAMSGKFRPYKTY